MTRAAIKQWSVVIAVGAAAVAGTWLYSANAHSVRIAEVTSTGCGPAAFGLPLTLLGEAAGSLPIAVGPITSDDLAQPLRITFDPSLSPTDRELTLREGALVLPTTFGRDPVAPERIGLNCRDGAVVSVRYTGRGSAATTFNVTSADAAEAVLEWESAFPTETGEAVQN